MFIQRPEFELIDSYDWHGWVADLRKASGVTRRDIKKMLNWPYRRYAQWMNGEIKMNIEEFTQLIELFGFRFFVFTGDFQDLDWLERSRKEGRKAPGKDPVILDDEYTDYRTFLRACRSRQNISMAHIERIFGLYKKHLWNYEMGRKVKLDFKLYLKILTYLEFRFAFIRGTVISSGNPQLFGIENFNPREKYYIRPDGWKNKVLRSDEGPPEFRGFSRWKDPD